MEERWIKGNKDGHNIRYPVKMPNLIFATSSITLHLTPFDGTLFFDALPSVTLIANLLILLGLFDGSVFEFLPHPPSNITLGFMVIFVPTFHNVTPPPHC